jgi:mRNA interferase MazF
VLLARKQTGLPLDSVANVSQAYTIDKSYLTEKAGRLPAAVRRRIDAGLRLVLCL